MVTFPNIKVNIGLNIVEKRQDGFHNIESVFHPVPFSDVLEIIPAKETRFVSTGIAIPGALEHNLCFQAYELLKRDFQLPPVQIHLHKVVPIGAGLGGGSSDAAFTLKTLNNLFELGITSAQLETYAQKLGSDCAFFIDNKAKYCYHKGDEFKNLELDLSTYFFVIIYPNIHISTPEAYAGIRPKKSDYNLMNIPSLPITEWKNYIRNDFEDTIFIKYPLLEQIKTDLYNRGAIYASMSGSGSSLFGIFDSPIDLSSLTNKYLVWTSNY